MKRKSTTIDALKRLQSGHEDIKLIRTLENAIQAIRPTVFRMPKPGTLVVLLLSGGMDSAAAWDTLISRYRLIVYPLAIRRRLADPQIRSIRMLSGHFRNRYPKQYRPPKIIRWDEFGGLLPSLSRVFAAGDTLLDSFDPSMSVAESPGSGSNVFFALHAALYAQTLALLEKAPVSTVFYGVTADDGLHIKTQTYSFLRLMMLMLMRFTGDRDFQFVSPFYESYLGAYHTKRDVLKRAMHAHVPMYMTYSCDRKGWFHCGVCISCQSRKYCFEKVGVPDPTWYTDAESMRDRIKRLMK